MTQQPFDPNAANDQNLVPAYCAPPRRGNTPALLAMIFGLIALPTTIVGIGVLLGVAALVLGIIALINVSKDPTIGRRGQAITGIVTGGLSVLLVPLLLIAAVVLPPMGRARELADRASCSANLRGIMESMILYSAEQATGGGGSFPCVNPPASAGAYLVQPAQPVGSTTSAPDTLGEMMRPGNRAVNGSPTAGLWMLVLRSQTMPQNYLCKSDGMATIPALLVDSLGHYAEDFGAKNISYAVAYPWDAKGKDIGPWYKDNTDSTCPYLSDMPPVNGDVYGGVTVAVQSAGIAAGPGRPKAFNSPNHNGAGQNVAYGDVHVEWRTSPLSGASGGLGVDNIFTASGKEGPGDPPSGLPDQVGIPPAPGRLGAPILGRTSPFDIEVVPSRKNDGSTQ